MSRNVTLPYLKGKVFPGGTWTKYLSLADHSETGWHDEEIMYTLLPDDVVEGQDVAVQELYSRLDPSTDRWCGLVEFTEPTDGLNCTRVILILDTDRWLFVAECDPANRDYAELVYVIQTPSRVPRDPQTKLEQALPLVSQEHAQLIVDTLERSKWEHEQEVKVLMASTAVGHPDESDVTQNLRDHVYWVLRETALWFGAESGRR